MVLRLYKGCRLSQNYDEVFYPHKISDVNIHAAYLATLEYVDIELDALYLTREGLLSFDWDTWANGNVDKYNYMRVSNDDLTSFAFITSATYINGIATVRYSVDVWHTYAPDMTLGNSLMTSTRFPKTSAPCALPLLPITNLEPTELFTNTSEKVGMIVQYQYFMLNAAGEQSFRQISTALVVWSADYSQTFSPQYKNDFETVAHTAVALSAASSTAQIDLHTGLPTWLGITHNFEIKTCWIIPEEWLDLIYNGVSLTVTPNEIKTARPDNELIFKFYDIAGLTFTKSYTIVAYPFTIGFGTHTNSTPISYNGLDRTASVLISASPADFTIELELDGGRSTIEGDFEFDIPIAAAGAAETQQAKISREIRNQQAASQLWTSAFSIAGSVGMMATGIGSLAVAPGLAAGQIAQGVGGVGGGISGLVQAIQTIKTNNSAIYSTNTGTRCTNSPALNAPRGLCTLIITPSNANEITAAINEQGYDVMYSTKALLPDNAPDETLTTRGYDVLKYSFVRIYGGFPESKKRLKGY